MPRISTLCSIVVHLVVIVSAVVWSVLAPGTLPSLREALAYTSVTPVKIADIPLAPAPRQLGSASASSSSAAAPIDAPAAVTPEPRGGPAMSAPGDGVAVERGIPEGFGAAFEGSVAPPPPPPPPTPRAPMRMHVGIEPPHRIGDAAPQYPAAARAARMEGIVILEAVINADGSVESVRVLRGLPLLDDAAAAAVRQWRFTPARLNHEPVPVVMTVTVTFTLR